MDRLERRASEHRTSMWVGRIFSFRVLLPGCGRECEEPDVDAVARRAIHANAVLWRDQDDRLAGQAGSCGQLETRSETASIDGSGSHLRQTEAVGPRAWTSRLPLSAAGFGDRKTECMLGDRHHVHPLETRIRVPGCDHGLVQPLRAVVGSVDHHGNEFLPDSPGLGIEEGEAGNLQLGPGSTVHQQGVHESFIGSWDCHQHGRKGAGVGQRLHRALVANRQVRRSVFERLHERRRSDRRSTTVFSVLQSRTFTSSIGLSDARTGLFFARSKGLWKMTLFRVKSGIALLAWPS